MLLCIWCKSQSHWPRLFWRRPPVVFGGAIDDDFFFNATDLPPHFARLQCLRGRWQLSTPKHHILLRTMAHWRIGPAQVWMLGLSLKSTLAALLIASLLACGFYGQRIWHEHEDRIVDLPFHDTITLNLENTPRLGLRSPADPPETTLLEFYAKTPGHALSAKILADGGTVERSWPIDRSWSGRQYLLWPARPSSNLRWLEFSRHIGRLTLGPMALVKTPSAEQCAAYSRARDPNDLLARCAALDLPGDYLESLQSLRRRINERVHQQRYLYRRAISEQNNAAARRALMEIVTLLADPRDLRSRFAARLLQEMTP